MQFPMPHTLQLICELCTAIEGTAISTAILLFFTLCCAQISVLLNIFEA